MSVLFQDRVDAGKKLAAQLRPFLDKNPLVLALPRGGVVVGYEVAKELHAPLDVVVVRKVGDPVNPELGVGALSEQGVSIVDQEAVVSLGITQEQLQKVQEKERNELERRISAYRGGKPLPNIKDKTIIIVDDGIATGITARAAIAAVQKLNPAEVVLAIPVCSSDTAEMFRQQNVPLICLALEDHLGAIGSFYRNFEQVEDDEVIELLEKSKLTR